MIFPVIVPYPRYYTHSFWSWACNLPMSPWHPVSALCPANLWFPAASSPVTTGHHENFNQHQHIHQPQTWQGHWPKGTICLTACRTPMLNLNGPRWLHSYPNPSTEPVLTNRFHTDHTLGDRIFKQLSCIKIHSTFGANPVSNGCKRCRSDAKWCGACRLYCFVSDVLRFYPNRAILGYV